MTGKTKSKTAEQIESDDAANKFAEAFLASQKGKSQNPNDLLKNMSKVLLERMLDSELTEHLGYKKGAIVGRNSGNSRNGNSSKTLKTNQGEVEISIPRDRNGDFEPQVIPKGKTHFDGFDDKIIALYASGISTREIQKHLEEIYGIEVAPDFISKVTDAVLEEVREWQQRPLSPVYPILYLDAIRLKIRSEGKVINKAIYLALGVNTEGHKELLGMWAEENEGAKFWMNVLTDIQNRGTKDVLIACVDGLTGFPEAIESVFPKTEVQLCIVHMIRNSTKYISYKERKEVCADLKNIYGAPTVEVAKNELQLFKEKWDTKYPAIARSWERRWENVIPFFQYSESIRKVIYTTNAIESLNMSIRKTTKTRGSFPSDEAAFKLLYLGVKKASKKWTMPIRNWGQAYNQLAIHFDGRLN